MQNNKFEWKRNENNNKIAHSHLDEMSNFKSANKREAIEIPFYWWKYCQSNIIYERY